MKSIVWVLAAVMATTGCSPLRRLAAANPQWRQMDKAPPHFNLVADHVTFRSSDDLNVAGWYIHAAVEPRAIVVACAGRGANKSSLLPRAKMLVDAGYDVLAIDLRGHGESEGTYPSPGYKEKAELRAAVAVAHRRHADKPIVLLGHSVGGVAVLHAAVEANPAVVGVIADSAFITYTDMMRRVAAGKYVRTRSTGEKIGLWFASAPTLGPLTRLVLWLSTGTDIDPDGGNLIPVLPKLAIPVLFVSGDRDDIAPTRNAWNMRFLVPGGRGQVAVLHAGHQTFDEAPEAYASVVLPWLDRVTAAAPTAVAGRRTR